MYYKKYASNLRSVVSNYVWMLKPVSKFRLLFHMQERDTYRDIDWMMLFYRRDQTQKEGCLVTAKSHFKEAVSSLLEDLSICACVFIPV